MIENNQGSGSYGYGGGYAGPSDLGSSPWADGPIPRAQPLEGQKPVQPMTYPLSTADEQRRQAEMGQTVHPALRQNLKAHAPHVADGQKHVAPPSKGYRFSDQDVEQGGANS